MLQATTTRYIVKALDLDLESAGGIILKSTTATQFAEIISIGTQVQDPLPLGAKIVIDWNQTVPVKHENATYYVVDYRAVAAVVEE
jgi:co-chaperonin GroES (HSP10)